MGIKPDQYKVFTMVKKRVLEVAIQEINEKTDLLVGYELENEGRKIAAIVFMIQSKDSVELLDDTQEVIWQKLKEFGIKEKQIKELLQKHDEQYLRANIAVVEEHAKTKDISNITGYLLKAISDDFRPRISAFKHQQKEKKNGKIEESQEEIEKKALLLKTKRNFEEQRSVALEKVLAEKNEAEITSLKDQFIAEKSHSSIMKSLIENK
jgi:plasmid replication initiation protein